jgi:hypothetical protein
VVKSGHIETRILIFSLFSVDAFIKLGVGVLDTRDTCQLSHNPLYDIYNDHDTRMSVSRVVNHPLDRSVNRRWNDFTVFVRNDPSSSLSDTKYSLPLLNPHVHVERIK